MSYEAKEDPSEDFRLVMGTEQVTRPKTCKTYDDDVDDGDVDICHLNVCVIMNRYRDSAI